jgi:hypothetical protein
MKGDETGFPSRDREENPRISSGRHAGRDAAFDVAPSRSRTKGGRTPAQPSVGKCPACGSNDTLKAGTSNGKPRMKCRACGKRSVVPGYRDSDGFSTAPTDPLSQWRATSDTASCGCGWSEPAISYEDALALVQDHRWTNHQMGAPLDAK